MVVQSTKRALRCDDMIKTAFLSKSSHLPDTEWPEVSLGANGLYPHQLPLPVAATLKLTPRRLFKLSSWVMREASGVRRPIKSLGGAFQYFFSLFFRIFLGFFPRDLSRDFVRDSAYSRGSVINPVPAQAPPAQMLISRSHTTEKCKRVPAIFFNDFFLVSCFRTNTSRTKKSKTIHN